MSRASDLLGILRGIQRVTQASLAAQEAYLKHLWSHSSVRDVIEKNAKQSSECGKKMVKNPTQELQNISNVIKETFERSSVVVEGIKQYTSSGRTSEPIGTVEMTNDTKSYSSIKNIKNLDIASITLKELENLLAEHNKMRQVSLRIDEDAKLKSKNSKKAEQKKIDPIPPVALKPDQSTESSTATTATASVAEDEKSIDNMMKFITNYDRRPRIEPIAVPEVSLT